MIKKHWPRNFWEAKLRELGCKPCDNRPRRATGEWWDYPSDHMPPFFVPLEEDDTIDGWALNHLVKHIKGEKPD